MKVGIYKQHIGGLHKGYLERYEKILHFNGIECIWLEASRPDFWDQVSELDLFIYQWEHYDRPKQIAESIIPIIQYEMNIPCFPNWASSWHYDDKIKQYYLLKQYGFPVIESYIFWQKNEASKWLEAARMPVVFKLKRGAGSSNVVLIDRKKEARRLISRMFGKGIRCGRINHTNSIDRKYTHPYKASRRFVKHTLLKVQNQHEPLYWNIEKDYVLFQKYLPNNSFDTRVSIVGQRAFAFRRFNREGDFRASGSGNINYDISKIDLNAIKIAFDISNRFGFQSMSYDFLFNADKYPEISEISYTYVDTAVHECPGYWDQDLNWHKGHFWPQYFQLVDELKITNLKQPNIK